MPAVQTELFLFPLQSAPEFSPPRTWISTYSPCRRATASSPSGFSMTALRFRSGPTCSQKTTGTLRTGGSESTSPGIDTAQGSPALASPHGVPLAGTRASPHWKGERGARGGGSAPRCWAGCPAGCVLSSSI